MEKSTITFSNEISQHRSQRFQKKSLLCMLIIAWQTASGLYVSYGSHEKRVNQNQQPSTTTKA